MEDALAHNKKYNKIAFSNCLNPCCNGRCTRTHDEHQEAHSITVLILVVMEDALAPSASLSNMRNAGVLILVVMEDALAPLIYNIHGLNFQS